MNTKNNEFDTQDVFFKPPPIENTKSLDNASAEEMNTTACLNFVEKQIIQEAIYDYKMLEKKGIVKLGKMIRPPRSPVEVLNYPNEHSVKHLLAWFQNKTEMAYWLDLARIQLAPEAILKGLGFPC